MSTTNICKPRFLAFLMVVWGVLFAWSAKASADSSIGFNIILGTPPPVVVYPAPRVVYAEPIYAEPIIIEHYPVYRYHHYVGAPGFVVVHPHKHWKKHWRHHGRHFDD